MISVLYLRVLGYADVPGPGNSAGNGSAGQDFGSIKLEANVGGKGSVDTSGSALLEEPTTGSLAPIYAPIAGSLGIGEGATTILGSSGSASGSLPATGSLVPAALGLGSVAAIYFAPEIHAALTAAGIALPPPPWAPAVGAEAPAQEAPAAPGPPNPNGRG